MSPAARPYRRSAAIAWLCALAIVFQAVILQSHIHMAPLAADEVQTASMIAAAPDAAAAKTTPAHTPVKNDPANCYLCQQLKLVGSTVLPVSPVVVAIERALTTETAAIATEAVTPGVSHNWRSRAPPIQL